MMNDTVYTSDPPITLLSSVVFRGRKGESTSVLQNTHDTIRALSSVDEFCYIWCYYDWWK